jgi:uncharacterized membrane protein YeaQ/YmgE (transglycosylase-associated protein family)
MKLRMYFMLPDVDSARSLANDLLLARITDRHMHFLARRDTDLGELHQASILQKTDMVHGAEVGLVVGGVFGAVVGAAVVIGFGAELVAVLLGGLIGALLGTWVASMIGTQMANSRLKAFEPAIEAGRILLLLDVPMTRASAIRELVLSKHPEAIASGGEASVPAFP